MTTQVMDIVRGKFLERQLMFIPKELVSIIRDYDDIYKTYFTKKVISILQTKVYLFWKQKAQYFGMNNTVSFTEGSIYHTKMKYYYTILWYIVIVPKMNDILKNS